MTSSTRTRLALLGTLSDLHHEPLAYDLARLQALVTEIGPDLLCAEITREAWEGDDLSDTALEVREALGPAVATSDIVLVPIAPDPKRFADFAPQQGGRRNLAASLDHLLRWAARSAGSPEAVNGLPFELVCHMICTLAEASWDAADRAVWDAQNEQISRNIVQAARNDPGRRVLVAVQCQRLHRLVPLLRAHREVFEFVPYREL